MSNSNSATDTLAFLAGFVIGGLVGAATALILAPQSGEETRRQMREKAYELRERAEEAAEEVAAESRRVYDEQRDRVVAAVEQGKQAAARKRVELMGSAGEAETKADAAPDGPAA